MSNYTFLDDYTFGLCLAAIRSAKQREYERIHCPLLNKTIDQDVCKQRKRNNTMSCQCCNDMMEIRKKYILNLIKYSRES